MTKNSTKRVPQIRFKGFEGEWEEVPLNLIVSRATQSGSETYLPRLEYEDIISGKGLLNKNIFKKKSNKKGIKFQKGDILFGKLRPYLKNWLFTEFEGIAVGDFWVLRSEKIVQSFLYLLIQTEKFEITANQSAGSKMPRSDWNLVSNSYFHISAHIIEQTQIGTFFKQLDSIIKLQQQKHEKLKILKKSFLQKMFPKKGETVPEIRFKGFEGGWESKVLGSISSTISNNTLSREYLNNKFGLAKNIHYGDILVKLGEIVDIKNDNLPFISDSNLIKNMIFSELENGDLVIADTAEDSSAGKCTELLNVGNTLVFAGLHTIALRPLISFASTYFGYFMNSNCFHDQLLPIMQGTKVLSISKRLLRETIVSFPFKIEEQTQIGTFFRKLDTLISLYAIQIKKYEQIKNACLAKMFV